MKAFLAPNDTEPAILYPIPTTSGFITFSGGEVSTDTETPPQPLDEQEWCKVVKV